ncbi:ankyrin repeat domain-containing protein SOWAHA [Pristis pectinata]|uniref:ankyrin repeat domain-containing protein SOWAHA n=1 Tax=Pristis pectinata TaxID=685728 RepID=UPI00223D5C8A|nr:ankyrin repeat domain-containing protein SOWAHA [Pristis pectinata]
MQIIYYCPGLLHSPGLTAPQWQAGWGWFCAGALGGRGRWPRLRAAPRRLRFEAGGARRVRYPGPGVGHLPGGRAMPAEELREDALLDFLAKNGGRVKNKALVERFKAFINAAEPQLRAKYRDIFKDIVNKIAVVKQEDGEKYIILKKKYQHLVQERGSNSKDEKMILNTPAQASFEQILEKDQPVNFGEEEQPGSLSDVQPFMPKSQNEASEIGSLSSAVITAPAKVNACEWIVPDLPTTPTMSKAPSEITSDSQGNPRLCFNEASEEKQDEKFDVASENNAANPVNIEIKVEEPQQEEFDSVFKDDLEQNGFEDGTGSMGSPSVALDPLEKEWLKCAAIGHLTALCDLLRQDPSLAMKKDFTSFNFNRKFIPKEN